MPNFKLTISYDGGDFRGWQTQPGLRTVQETLEHAVAKITNLSRVRLMASGRTDTGVHAVGQVANTHVETRMDANRLLRAVNGVLPDDVRVRAAEVVPDAFDANRDAVRKLYRYVLHDGDVPDVFLRKYAYHCRYKLDAAAMKRASAALLGTHDFRCFETEWPNRATSVRTISHLGVSRFGDWLWVDAEADGFLYNMVRAIVGTLVNIGRGFWEESRMAEVIAAGDRTLAGPTAPACGLFLMRVRYEETSPPPPPLPKGEGEPRQ